jgi:hypothetical protein
MVGRVSCFVSFVCSPCDPVIVSCAETSRLTRSCQLLRYMLARVQSVAAYLYTDTDNYIDLDRQAAHHDKFMYRDHLL